MFITMRFRGIEYDEETSFVKSHWSNVEFGNEPIRDKKQEKEEEEEEDDDEAEEEIEIRQIKMSCGV